VRGANRWLVQQPGRLRRALLATYATCLRPSEVDATLPLRFPFARHMTIALGYLAYFPRAYLKDTGPHARAQQFAIDISGQF
jgi:hypothetical protein